MGRGNQPHTALRNGPRGFGFIHRSDFIHDDNLRHMIFHRFDHHFMLKIGR